MIQLNHISNFDETFFEFRLMTIKDRSLFSVSYYKGVHFTIGLLFGIITFSHETNEVI